MRKLISAVVMLCTATLAIMPVNSFAKITANQKYRLNNHVGPAAFAVQLGTKLDQVEIVNGTSTLQASDNHLLKRLARVTWDATVSSQGSSSVNSGIHSLGITLPHKAIITRSFYQVHTAATVSGGGSPTLAIHCEDANNILSA